MQQSLADRGDGEKLIDANVLGVNFTDSQQQPSKIYMT